MLPIELQITSKMQELCYELQVIPSVLIKSNVNAFLSEYLTSKMADY
jgi:hypothetical protein